MTARGAGRTNECGHSRRRGPKQPPPSQARHALGSRAQRSTSANRLLRAHNTAELVKRIDALNSRIQAECDAITRSPQATETPPRPFCESERREFEFMVDGALLTVFHERTGLHVFRKASTLIETGDRGRQSLRSTLVDVVYSASDSNLQVVADLISSCEQGAPGSQYEKVDVSAVVAAMAARRDQVLSAAHSVAPAMRYPFLQIDEQAHSTRLIADARATPNDIAYPRSTKERGAPAMHFRLIVILAKQYPGDIPAADLKTRLGTDNLRNTKHRLPRAIKNLVSINRGAWSLNVGQISFAKIAGA